MTDSARKEEDEHKVADAIRHSWVYILPGALWPYAQLARWERPIGWQLLMWPCWWSAMLAFQTAASGKRASPLPDANTASFWLILCIFLMLYLLGAAFMRGAGCTYNDLVDQDIDNQVARTRSRPLPSGRASRKGALIFLVLQALAGLGVLIAVSSYYWFAFWLGVASLVTVAVYPFMKRVTWWPQLFLGFAFSWGALMGWAAIFGEVSGVSLSLYAGSICWVIAYDTIYAHQDIEDDALVGVKSTARLFAENTRAALMVFYGLAVFLWGVALFLSGAIWPAWAGLATVATHMVWQISNLNIADPVHCLRLFKSNSRLGAIFFSGIFVATVVTAIG